MKKQFMRAVLSLLLCIVMLVSAVSTSALADAWQSPFDDVRNTDWFYEHVGFVTSNGYFNGTSENSFSPDAAMNRGMYVTVLGRLAGIDAEDYYGESFNDVAGSIYYAPYVNWASESEIVFGTGEGSFSPERSINREEMAAILSRYCDWAGIGFTDSHNPDFADGTDISDWAKDSVAKMTNAGVIKGVDTIDGKMFYPKNSASRASVAALISRFAAATGQDGSDLLVRSYFEFIIEKNFEESDTYIGPLLDAFFTDLGGSEQFYETSVFPVTGDFLAVADVTFYMVSGDYIVYAADIQTTGGSVSALVTIDEYRNIEGLNIIPSATPEDPIIMPDGFTETQVTVDAGSGYPLEAYVVKPEDTSVLSPAVLLIQGSGASNYDEIAGANRVFGQIARGLARQGIASLRYDKRNYTYPEITLEPDYSIEEEYIEDVLAAVELLKAQDGVDPDKVFILGHSQGGMLAPLFLDRGAGAAGMILFAGTPRSLFDVLEDQQEDMIEYLSENGMEDYAQEYRDMQEIWRAELDALRTMTAEEAKQAGTVYSFNAYYAYILEQYNAISTIKGLSKPVLILQGGNDHQVYADVDYEIYKQELKDESYASFKLYDGLNHMFMPSAAENIMDAINEYNIPAEIPDEVFEDIADWIISLGE